MLDREFHYYNTHENELVKRYKGKFIAIVGEEVVGVFDSELIAYQEMKTKYAKTCKMALNIKLVLHRRFLLMARQAQSLPLSDL